MDSAKSLANDAGDAPLRWSCVMDGEADPTALQYCLDEWSRSDAARAQWTLWHVAGDALRSSEVASWHSQRFGARLAQALAAEPAIVAPRRLRHRTVRRVVLPGMAAVAAAAVLAVVAVPMLRTPGSGTTEVAMQQPVPPPAPMPQAATMARVATPPQIDLYIAAHREMTDVVGMPRTTPYLRTTTILPER